MLKREQYYLRGNEPIYAYLPAEMDSLNRSLTMILDLNCTTGNPQAEVKTNGWDQLVDQEKLIVIAPTYNDYATYSECNYLKKVIDDAVSRYPIDVSRIYSVGFSNGGATSVALASSFPHLFAGIAAMGWMVSPQQTRDLTIPFMVIQGTREYTSRNFKGQMMIMRDEREALADLMASDDISTDTPDYGRSPYWGYPSDYQETITPDYNDYDPYGHSKHHQTTKKWQINRYFKDGFHYPFAELVLVEDAPHIPHDYNARLAWDFLKSFKRNSSGHIIEN